MAGFGVGFPKDLDADELDDLNGKRGELPDDQLADDIRQFRAINAANRLTDTESGSAPPTIPLKSAAPSQDAPASDLPQPQTNRPDLPHFMEVMKPRFPDISDRELHRYWAQRYSDSDPTTLPTFETFLPAAKAKNPGATDQDIKAYWDEYYGDFGAAEKNPPASSLFRRAADLPLGIAKGITDVPKAVVGLADIPTVGAAGRASDAILKTLGEVSDQIGLPSWARPSQWSKQLAALYSPETKANLAEIGKQSAEALAESKAAGDGALSQIGAQAMGAGKALATHPGALIPFAAENYGGMKLIAMGVAKALAPFSTALNDAVQAGTLTQAAADKALGSMATTASAIGEGILTTGQVSSGISERDPSADFAHRLSAVLAGVVTGGIAKGVGSIPGLGDVEASMATATLGRATGFAGKIPVRMAKGAFSEGPLQEVPQSTEEAVLENIGASQPWQDNVGDQAIIGGVTGTALGGGMAGLHGQRPTPQLQPPKTDAEITQSITSASSVEDAIATADTLLKEPPVGHSAIGPEFAIGAEMGGYAPAITTILPQSSLRSLQEQAARTPGGSSIAGVTVSPTVDAETQQAVRLAADLEADESVLVESRTPPRPLDEPVSPERTRQAYEPPILPGKQSQTPTDPTGRIVPGSAVTPREAETSTPHERIAQERQKLLAMKQDQQEAVDRVMQQVRSAPKGTDLGKAATYRPSTTTQPVQAATEVPLPSARDQAYPSVSAIRTLATEKGVNVESPIFKEVVKAITKKTVLSDLTPLERQKLSDKLQKLTPAPAKAPAEPYVRKDQPAALAAPVNEPLVKQPRSALPPEQNAEMLLRAEKAQADLEASVSGGQAGFTHQFDSGPGRGEKTSFKSANAQWYKDLTMGKKPMIKSDKKQSARERIEEAIAKIIKDEGSDRGAAVEKVKTALLADHEFNLTPWGRDLTSLLQGDWPSWVDKPAQPPHAAAPSRETMADALPSTEGRTTTPDGEAAIPLTPIQQEQAKLQTKKTKNEPAQARVTSAPSPAYLALPATTREKFESAFAGAAKGDRPSMRTLKEWMYGHNKTLRAEFERRTGVNLPKGLKATNDAVEAYFSKRKAVASGSEPSDIAPSAKSNTEAPVAIRQEKDSQPVEKPGQQEIPVPPPTVGARPIIGREATPEEAPLFSKAAQQAESEQAELPQSIATEATATPEYTQKETWQMTAIEFVKAHVPASMRDKITKPQASFEAQHRKDIKEARYRGETIPAEVLADYPDLQPQAQDRPRKEPWEMSVGEFQQVAEVRRSGPDMNVFVPGMEKILIPGTTSWNAAISQARKFVVQKALLDGRAVPGTVLNDYPDLQPKGEEKASHPPSPTEILAQALRGAADKIEGKPAPIVDVGEKVGGARKDLAEQTGPRSTAKKADDGVPGWKKRYAVSQITKSLRPGEEGKWVLLDTRQEDWQGRPKRLEKLFDSKEEAEAAIPLAAVSRNHRVYKIRGDDKYEIYRKLGDRKIVKAVNQVFETETDAMRHMATHAQEIIETKLNFGEEVLPRPETVRRIGEDRRNGKNVTAEDFRDTFTFRAVEFGNWNNQIERQEVMNHAYDGLLDLAEVLGIPANAIGLNGELALAFGARGHGLTGARAHYERDYGVINLTKMEGAGALAHEWFHATDHYFGRQEGKAKRERVQNSRGDLVFKASLSASDDYVSHGFLKKDSGVRAEVRAAYTHLMETMFSRAEQYVEDTQKVERFVGEAKTDVAKALNEIRNGQYGGLSRQLDERYYKRNHKPASAEQLAAFDGLAEKIIAGEFLETTYKLSDNKNAVRKRLMSGRWTNDALERLSAINKAVRGRSGFGSGDVRGPFDELRGYMNRYSARLKMLADAQKGTEKTKRIPTDYVREATSIDQGRLDSYWATPHEMAARAFAAYVEDRLKDQGKVNDYIVYGTNTVIDTPWGWKRPYPTGEERNAIDTAFDTLFSTMQTKETEQGAALFQRRDDAEWRSTLQDLGRLATTMRRVRGSEQAKFVRSKIIGKPLTNRETGLTATVSSESFRKMLSKSAVDRSITPQAHMQALGNLDALFPLATLAYRRAGKKADDERHLEMVHRFTVPMPFDGDVLRVDILAKQFVDEQQGSRLYLVEAVEIVTPASLEARSVEGGSASSPTVPPRPAGVNDRLAQMVAAVKGEDSGILFDRGQDGLPLLSHQDIVAVAGRIDAGSATNIYVRSYESLPEPIRQDAERMGDPSEFRAVWWHGDIYLITDRFTSAKDVEEAIFHELYHKWVAGFLGGQMQADLNAIFVKLGGKEAILKLADKYKWKEARSILKSYAARTDLTKTEQIAAVVNELLAEAGSRNHLTIQWKIREFVGEVRNWLRKHGFLELAKVTESDLAYLLKQAKAASGQHKGKTPYFQRAENDANLPPLAPERGPGSSGTAQTPPEPGRRQPTREEFVQRSAPGLMRSPAKMPFMSSGVAVYTPEPDYEETLDTADRLTDDGAYATRSDTNPTVAYRLAESALDGLTSDGVETLSDSGGAGRRPPEGVGANLRGVVPSRSGVETIAVGIRTELAQEGRVDLRGHRIRSAKELATLAQIFRHPGFETFRVIYLRGNEIVAHEGLTSRLPASSKAFIDMESRDSALTRTFPGRTWDELSLSQREEVTGRQMSRTMQTMQQRMERLGADGYYILHNHPTGNANGSEPDVAVTYWYERLLPGFRGHVIINSNHYAVFEPGGREFTVHSLNMGEDKLLSPGVPHPLLYEPVKNLSDIVRLGKRLQTPDEFVVIFHAADGQVRAIQEMPVGLFLQSKNAGNFLRGQARAFGGGQLYAYAPQNTDALRQSARELIREGYLADYVSVSRGFEVERWRTFLDRKKTFGLEQTPGKRVSAENVFSPGNTYSRIIGDAGRQYTPEQRQAMARTGSIVTPKTIQQTVKDLWTDAGKKLAQGLVDQFRPVRDLSQQAYTLLRLSKGATGAFEAFLHHGKLSIKDGAFDADTSGGDVPHECGDEPVEDETPHIDNSCSPRVWG